MKLTMLGTGNATVTKIYNTCFVLSQGEQHFLIDAGGGNQILGLLEEQGIGLETIHDLFVTHAHLDHVVGVLWLIRMVGQKINQGKYEGELRIYCHSGLVWAITQMARLTIQGKVTRHLGERIRFISLEDGDKARILGGEAVFFDIHSTKERQFGFTYTTPEGVKLGCCGDEPYREEEEKYIRGCDWLMHEAFCLYGEADTFKPYEKHHSTVKDACELAQKLEIPNLILYHTEETHGSQRKVLYVQEGCRFYTGNLYVPDDGESFIL